ncbi:MAG: Bax inhibitor-1/YccA family protein [Patescibacteria group bacterium]
MNTVQDFFRSIYQWMVIGILISAAMAYLTINSPLVVIFQNSVYFYGLIAIQLGILFGVQWGINRLSAANAFLLYLAYAALNGMTMAGFLAYFLATDPMLVVVIFLVAASMFAFLAVWGYFTKNDLSGWGTFLIAAVWGIFFSSIANIFLQSDTFSFIISGVALIIFAALTVYDNQAYRQMFAHLKDDEQKSKMATLGALHMYINFIMMFQSLLNLTQLFND